ncbi:MAG: tail fiber protein [Peptostreptococcaceae bacterium]|jgi:microcystin-dependent protein|nr:tail fiber protein [Peptostreptococcaceae bacterium]
MYDAFIGTIELYPYTYAPRDWAYCDGQLLQIAQHTSLFALIGTKFGGDGRTTFALPNLNGAHPYDTNGAQPDPNMKYCIALEGIFPSRS